jgi:hypothetical protein
MADLFKKDSDIIGLHIGNIFKEMELKESSATEDSSVVQQKGRFLRKSQRQNYFCSEYRVTVIKAAFLNGLTPALPI